MKVYVTGSKELARICDGDGGGCGFFICGKNKS